MVGVYYSMVWCAMVDFLSLVKGGFRWSLAKEHSFKGKYFFLGVWHTIVKIFKNPSLKLRLRKIERFDLCTSGKEVIFLYEMCQLFSGKVVDMNGTLRRL